MKAKENQKQSSGRGVKGWAKLPNLKPTHTRREIVAKMAKENLSAGGKNHRGNQHTGVLEPLAKLPKVPYLCYDCGESFSHPVWHCRKCGHHWPMETETCSNCHLSTKRGSPKAKKSGELNTRRELAKAAGVGERTVRGGDKKSKSPDVTLIPTLSSLGISKRESSEAQ